MPRDTATVIIAPDGLLTAIPWAALPGDEPGAVLLDRYAVATVPYAPFVLDRVAAPKRSEGGAGTLLGVRVLGDDPSGASPELDTVIKRAGARRVVRLVGGAATTAPVLRELTSAQWAHSDTHGFFADPSENSVLSRDADPFQQLRTDK